MNTLSHTKLDL